MKKGLFSSIMIGALLITCSLDVIANSFPIVYRLSNFYNTALKVKVEVDTRYLENFILVESRGSMAKNPLPTKQVFCADDNRIINYHMAQNCSLVYWFIDLKRQPTDGIIGAGQDDYYLNNGQWLITEAYNFPRFDGYTNASVCVNNTCQPMSAEVGYPLFFIWGKQPTTFKSTSGTLNIFTDQLGEQLLDKVKLVNFLEPRYQYINKVFKVKTNIPTNIIWLSREVGTKNTGGIAGYHAFLANFEVTNKQLTPASEDNLLIRSLHEYAHVSSSYSFSTWISESLAEYYAYKAVSLGQYNEKLLQAWLRQGITAPYASTGLYEASRRVQVGERGYYGLFYFKGAAFWNVLDKMLLEKNASLDDFISYLASSDKDIKLPPLFINKVTTIIGGDNLNNLIKQYLE